MKRIKPVLLILLTSLAVTACGLRGDLERPPPLWGNPQETSEDNEDTDS